MLVSPFIPELHQKSSDQSIAQVRKSQNLSRLADAASEQRDQQQNQRADQESAIGTDSGHEPEDRQEGTQDTASCGDGIELPGSAPRFPYLLNA
jgi:hypothetical protein